MSHVEVGYDQSTPGGKIGTTTLTTSEQDLVVISTGGTLAKSQLTVFINTALGGAASIKFRYYASPDSGTTWFAVPIKNSTSGELADVPSVVDSGSPTQDSGTSYKVYENVATPACTNFKVTGYTNTSTATLNSLFVVARDN